MGYGRIGSPHPYTPSLRVIPDSSRHITLELTCCVLQVLSLALPALGTVLADPLMSLVDTACVGQISSVELAALGPNTAIFNFVFQVRLRAKHHVVILFCCV